jgi:hypothetical protein
MDDEKKSEKNQPVEVEEFIGEDITDRCFMCRKEFLPADGSLQPYGASICNKCI